MIGCMCNAPVYQVQYSLPIIHEPSGEQNKEYHPREEEHRMQAFLVKMVQKHRPQAGEGKVADYIPELSRQNSAALGVSVYTSNGETFSAGDCSVQYSLQSISKVITLIIALMDWGPEKVFERVGMEPTGNPFNAISD